ncbi:hypothetical protein F9C07_5785 [Aspergillus flavus]|uniref:Uncharacterized protein n=1 Tax=Aspergillus flavus (strain ATCC 200026 / FGSC A1120 / IAM 13836 / NRRL 3357 / JCM 12722 / SRRC 167) TaxID=332952 RepID=A0A7U2R0L5_ASPFN|nr:hypothetical protein F9C07_5785 [Aspergillus flavus]
MLGRQTKTVSLKKEISKQAGNYLRSGFHTHSTNSRMLHRSRAHLSRPKMFCHMAKQYNSPPSTLYTRNNKSKTPKMSAPNSGRQSPPPEKQTGAQQQDPVASGHTQHGIHGDSKGASEDTKLHGLESNPKHPLEDIEAKKFEKGTGN